MAEKDVVEVIYGRSHKFEIVRRSTYLVGIKFDVLRDGKVFSSDYSSLADAVARAKKEG
ncbi:MAG: hypothetical protein QOJ39_2097 [Candidatus Eremiobacteraeota bacterium]|nr:hypothetical protein [Candidatus Eremiobacteraeota bacterium]MEA2720233.1 hypothetical protein [Candidatus Eremiobacteraeota bacterium]